MSHKLYKVTDFKIISGFVVWIRFDDATEQIVNFEPVLYGEMLSLLRDPDYFRQVRLDPIACTLTWPNGVDFDPETLHNWPEYKDELAQRARQMEQVFA